MILSLSHSPEDSVKLLVLRRRRGRKGGGREEGKKGGEQGKEKKEGKGRGGEGKEVFPLAQNIVQAASFLFFMIRQWHIM